MYYVLGRDPDWNHTIEVYYRGESGVEALDKYQSFIERHLAMCKMHGNKRWWFNDKYWLEEAETAKEALRFVRENPDLVLKYGHSFTIGDVTFINIILTDGGDRYVA